MKKDVKIFLRSMIDMVNERNARSTCSPDIRRGWNDLLETVLHQNGVYSGFFYLTPGQVPVGEMPGIVRNGDDVTFPDETRRGYYFHRTLCFSVRVAPKEKA